MNDAGLISKAWKTAWRNKQLWFFGFLSSGILLINYNSIRRFPALLAAVQISDAPSTVVQLAQQLQFFLSQTNLTLLWIFGLLISVGLWIVKQIITNMGLGGIIVGVTSTEDIPKVKTIYTNSRPYIKTLFKVDLLLWGSLILVAICFSFLIVPLSILFSLENLNSIVSILLICILVIGIFLATEIIAFGKIAVVTENLGAWDSLKRGWHIVRHNLGALISLNIKVLIISIPLSAIFIALFFVWGAANGFRIGDDPANYSRLWLYWMGNLAMYPFRTLAFAFLATFYEAIWVYFFQEIKNKESIEESSEVTPEIALDVL